jgi:hypothetical protein
MGKKLKITTVATAVVVVAAILFSNLMQSPAQAGPGTGYVKRWSRFFEQNLRVVKWTPAGLRAQRGVS